MSHLQAPKLPISGMVLFDSPCPNPLAITVHSGNSSEQEKSTPSLLLPTPTQLLTVICLDP